MAEGKKTGEVFFGNKTRTGRNTGWWVAINIVRYFDVRRIQHANNNYLPLLKTNQIFVIINDEYVLHKIHVIKNFVSLLQKL